MSRCAVLKVWVALLLAVAPVWGGAAPPEPAGGLEGVLADLCRKHGVPSLTVAVVRSGGTVATACHGVRKRGTDDTVELSDRHPLGSCTKSMTATLAAVLVESGQIGWDTTVAEVWPHADGAEIHPELRAVTLNELLSHQSGLASDANDQGFWISFFAEEAAPRRERRRMVEWVLAQGPEHPRGGYHYSNLGYVVAGAMLEKRGGASFESLMRRHVFKPLGMETAAFRTLARARKLKPPLRWGHRANGAPIDPRAAGAENPAVYAPCGTVHLTVADYARYARWHLGREPAPVLTKPETLDRLHTGQVKAPALGGAYGGGWILIDTGLGPALTHGGSNTNSQALIWVLPERDFAAVAFTNTGEHAGFLACNAAIQELMNRYAEGDGE